MEGDFVLSAQDFLFTLSRVGEKEGGRRRGRGAVGKVSLWGRRRRKRNGAGEEEGGRGG